MSLKRRIIQLLNGSRNPKILALLNIIITAFKSKIFVITKYDNANTRFIHKHKSFIFYVDEKVYWNGTIKKLERDLFRIYCKEYLPVKNDTIIDVGAGIGTESILLSKMIGPNGRIFAIEANPNTYKSLELLIRLNNIKNIKYYNLAIGNKDTTINIENRDKRDTNRITADVNQGTAIIMKTLDSFIKSNEIKKIDFLKMNIEGAEELAIEGMINTIKVTKNIAVSCHDFLQSDTNERIKKKITLFLINSGFHVINTVSSNAILSSWIYGKRSS